MKHFSEMPNLEKKTEFVLFSEMPDLVSKMSDLEKNLILVNFLKKPLLLILICSFSGELY
jgi:hypothetical protein